VVLEEMYLPVTGLLACRDEAALVRYAFYLGSRRFVGAWKSQGDTSNAGHWFGGRRG